jgi:hypothetical protein
MANASPTWGKWVVHYDSAGQAPTMALAFSPDNTIASITFDRMIISLQGDDQYKMAGSIGFAGHFPLALPDEFRLDGYLLIARGIVMKSPDASAVLTVSIGERAVTQEWPRTGKVFDVSGKEPVPVNELEERDITISCFTGDQHLAIGDPPKFPPAPPLTLSIGMHARRRSVEGAMEMHLDALDIVMLRSH